MGMVIKLDEARKARHANGLWQEDDGGVRHHVAPGERKSARERMMDVAVALWLGPLLAALYGIGLVIDAVAPLYMHDGIVGRPRRG